MTEKTTVGNLYQFTCDIGNGSSLSISGNFPLGADTATMNEVLDPIKAVYTRFRAQHEAPLIAERIEGTKGQLEQAEIDYAEYMRKHEKARDVKLVARMEMQLADLRVNISKGEIALLEALEKAK